MDILKGFRFFQVFLVVSVCLVSIITFPSNGYSDNWVYVGINDNFSVYYNKSSVKIDKDKKTIEVWEKRIYTDKGRKILLKDIDINKEKYADINYTLILYLLDYKNWLNCITQITYYSKSGNILFDQKYPRDWFNIIPDSTGDTLFSEILRDNNIQR